MFFVTFVGRNGLSLNCLSLVARIKVPKNNRTEKKNISGTYLHHKPERWPPNLKNKFSYHDQTSFLYFQWFYAMNKNQLIAMTIYHSHSCFSSNPHGTVSAVRVKLVMPSCSFLRFIIAWKPSAVVALSRVCSIKPGIIVLFSISNHYNSWSFLDTTCLNFYYIIKRR